MISKKLFIITLICLLQLPFAVFAAYPSQCQTGREEGSQSGCTHENDKEILEKQCATQYASSHCTSMATYLNAMTVDCAKKNPPDIDCSMISQNGIYGREAAKFAAYLNETNNNNDDNEEGNEKNPKVPGISCGITTGWNKSNFSCLNLPQSGSITEIIFNIFYWLLYILGIAGVLGFATAGIMYLLARDNDTAAQKAKKAMTYSIYGIIIGLSGIVVITAVFRMLSGDIEF